MSTIPIPKFEINRPHEFDGSPLKFKTWLREVNLYLLWFPALNSAQKIRLALGFMSGSPAVTQWRDTYLDNHIAIATVIKTWNDFIMDASIAFSDKNAVERARQALDDTYQKGMRIDEYVTKFDSLCTDCSMTSDCERI